MEANSRNLKTVFGQDRRYIVPLFQRPYVWTRAKQWEPLWEDIRYLVERSGAKGDVHPHFLGAIVMEQQPVPLGAIEERLLIDGQQRLTTLQIVLAAARDVSSELQGVEHKHTQTLSKLTRNDDPMIDRAEDRFKVWPTNVDRAGFMAVMTAGSPETVRMRCDVKKDRATHRRIPDAYLFFYETVREWVGEGERMGPRFGALLEVLRQCLHVVIIDLAQQDDAQVIFETLNARGTPLRPADLVKSFLLHAAEQQSGDVQVLYDTYWARFDESAWFWRQDVLTGRHRRPQMDLFLQHYLTLQTRVEVPVTHIYDTFRDWASAVPEMPVSRHFEELYAYADIYEQFGEAPQSGREGRFFYRLQQMEMSTAMPFLMALFRQFGGEEHEEDRGAILKDLESFLVRRFIVRLSTRGYNRLFLELLQGLSAAIEESRANVRTFLTEGAAESNRWPSDDEFKAAWMTMPAYRTLRKARVRMLLEAIEAELASPLTEKVQLAEKLTVEHILPRKWHDHWPFPTSEDTKEASVVRDGVLHTLGNLTLLNGKLNPQLSNGPWEKKRSALKAYSVLRLNQKLCELDTWDEASIRRRGEELFQIGRRLWPRPG